MSANIGYLFSRDFYRDEEMREVTRLADDAIKTKVSVILNARPFEDGRLDAVCLPVRLPKPTHEEQSQPQSKDRDELDRGALLLWAGKGNKGLGLPTPEASKKPPEKNEKDVLSKNGIRQLRLRVLYPGLYSGMGYLHGQESNEDFKTGFSFDYTTGLPYLPGSSVKGALRACFTDRAEDTLEALRVVLKGKGNMDTLEKLEVRLFGSRIGGRDDVHAMGAAVFYDAFPCKSSRPLMAVDSITPHKNPLKNPLPIQTIKVGAGVSFAFHFKIPPVVLEADVASGQPEVRAGHVRDLFEILLIDWGAGAKTNTGYGSFEKDKER